MEINGIMIFFEAESTVLPHIPNLCPLNSLMAQSINAHTMMEVFPDRTLPSHMIESNLLYENANIFFCFSLIGIMFPNKPSGRF